MEHCEVELGCHHYYSYLLLLVILLTLPLLLMLLLSIHALAPRVRYFMT